MAARLVEHADSMVEAGTADGGKDHNQDASGRPTVITVGRFLFH
jgi:hypothetical protein